MSNQISVRTLRAWLADGAELAVLDVRDAAEVGYASPLFATNLPAPRVRAELARYVPRKAVRTVLVDDGGGAAAKLVEQLTADGWPQVVALDGGLPAWTAQDEAELPTFGIPGKDFSLGIRDERSTPAVTAAELRQLRADGADVVVLDTRTLPEFAAGHVPGAVGVPGAELLLRFKDVVPSLDTHVIVSCAGLPRAIIDAQTLIDAGVPNKVSFLYDGTSAWKEDGLELETGAIATYGQAGEDARKYAAERRGRRALAPTARLRDRDSAARLQRSGPGRLTSDPPRNPCLVREIGPAGGRLDTVRDHGTNRGEAPVTVPPTRRRPRLDVVKAAAEPVLGRRTADRIATFGNGDLYVEAAKPARALAWAVDFVVFALGVVVSLVLIGGATVAAGLPSGVVVLLVAATLVVVPAVYGFWYGNGRGLGAVLAGTQLVRLSDGGPIGAKACWVMMLRTVLTPLWILAVVKIPASGISWSPDGSLVRISIDPAATNRLRAMDLAGR